jgi:hypothetical protein
MNTATVDSVFADIVTIASCVLSPNSAKNKVTNAVPSIFQSIRKIVPPSGALFGTRPRPYPLSLLLSLLSKKEKKE